MAGDSHWDTFQASICCCRKLDGLGIPFNGPISGEDNRNWIVPFRRDMLPRRPLSMIRLASFSHEYTISHFVSGELGTSLDLTHLRSLALCSLNLVSCPTTAWLSSLLSRCSASLENLALELVGSPEGQCFLLFDTGCIHNIRYIRFHCT